MPGSFYRLRVFIYSSIETFSHRPVGSGEFMSLCKENRLMAEVTQEDVTLLIEEG